MGFQCTVSLIIRLPDSGPVSLVGWVYQRNACLRLDESQFEVRSKQVPPKTSWASLRWRSNTSIQTRTTCYSPPQFSDGSGRITVKVDVPSQQESWLLPRLQRLVLGVCKDEVQEEEEEEEKDAVNIHDNGTDENEPSIQETYRYLRLVANVTQDVDDGKIVVRYPL